MGLKTFLARNVSNRVFGSGRLIIHKPWDSDINMAKDPCLNLRKLASLSHSGDAEIRDAAAQNLAQRLGDQLLNKDLMTIYVFFNRNTIISALERAPRLRYVYPGTEHFIQEFLKTLAPENLDSIVANTGCLKILGEIAKIPKTPKTTLIKLIAKIISIDTPKSGVISVERPGETLWDGGAETIPMGGGMSNMRIGRYVTDSISDSHSYYTEADVKHALSLLRKHADKKRSVVLAELEIINSELTEKIKAFG